MAHFDSIHGDCMTLSVKDEGVPVKPNSFRCNFVVDGWLHTLIIINSGSLNNVACVEILLGGCCKYKATYRVKL